MTNTSFPHRRLVWAAPCLLVLALGSACGNDAAATASPAATAPTSAATSADAPTSSAPRTSAPTTADTTQAGDAICALDDLKIGVRAADGGGAAGSAYAVLTFTNTGSATCTLEGYPGVSFVGKSNGTQLGVPAVRRKGEATPKVEIAPTKSTTALLQIVNAGNYDTATCKPKTADGFRIYPPNSTTSAFVADKTKACTKNPGTTKQLTISPIGTKG